MSAIILDFSESKEIVVERRYQYDYGQSVRIVGADVSEPYELHFANKYLEHGIIVDGGVDTTLIPNELFHGGTDINVWTFLHDGESDGRTMYHAVIPITRRPRPVYTEGGGSP